METPSSPQKMYKMQCENPKRLRIGSPTNSFLWYLLIGCHVEYVLLRKIKYAIRQRKSLISHLMSSRAYLRIGIWPILNITFHWKAPQDWAYFNEWIRLKLSKCNCSEKRYFFWKYWRRTLMLVVSIVCFFHEMINDNIFLGVRYINRKATCANLFMDCSDHSICNNIVGTSMKVARHTVRYL